MNLRLVALLGLAGTACRGAHSGTASGDASAARTAASPAAAAGPGAAMPANTAIDSAVRAACDGVARFYGRLDSTAIRRTDSVLTPYASDAIVRACVVLVDQEHGMRRDIPAPVDTAAQHLGTALALVRGAGPGWVPLYRYGADGPDGSSLAYQRGRVRCLVEDSWDGGDDSDSTYVPADWFKQATTCWLTSRELVPSDTATGG